MLSVLFIAAVVIFICVLLNRVSNKIGVPTLLIFIILGMLFGSEGIVKISFEDFTFAKDICSVALIFIMFYGGFGTRWSEAKPVAVKSILLSSVGVVLTAGFVGAFCWLVLGMPVLESFLIGSVISSTDAASVFSILRSKKLGLKYNTASMLEVESGSNDPFAYMLTMLILMLMEGNASAGRVAYMLFAQIAYGAAIGVVIAVLSVMFLKKFKFAAQGYQAIFIFAIAIFSFVVPELIGGNGYLSTYIVGIIVGNAPMKNKKDIVSFFDGTTSLMQMLIFFLLGLLSTPSKLLQVFVPGVLIAVFLTVIARPLSIIGVLSPFKCKFNQQLLVAFSGLRGAASIVFAIMAMVSDSFISTDIFHIVFFIVLLSISVQGTLIPHAAKKLKMTDENANVLKTFSDYQEEEDVEFIKLHITKDNPWVNMKIKDIVLPKGTLVVMIFREDKTIVPSGKTLLEAEDIVVLSAPSYKGHDNIHLKEYQVSENSGWQGKKIAEYSPNSGELVIMIKRGERTIIPNGQTVIEKDDILVINNVEI